MSETAGEIQQLDSRELVQNLLELSITKMQAGLFPTELPNDPPDSRLFVRVALRDDDELATAYHDALRSLYLELVPNHTNFPDLYLGLWELFRKTVSSPVGESDSAALRDEVERFAEEYKPPLAQRDVAFTIEHLDLGSRSIVLDRVTFLTPDESYLTEIGFPIDQWQKRVSDVGAMSLACVTVYTAHSNLRFEAGRTPVLAALGKLKISALQGLSSNGDPDELLLWKLGAYWVTVKEASDPMPMMANYHRPFRPSVIDIGETVENGIEKLKIDRLSTLPEDIRK